MESEEEEYVEDDDEDWNDLDDGATATSENIVWSETSGVRRWSMFV